MYLIDSRVAKRLAKSWQGGSGHGSGGRGGGGEGGGREEEEEKKEKKEKKEDNKIGVAEKSFHYCHAWCRFVIAILGLARGVPFADLFFSIF